MKVYIDILKFFIVYKIIEIVHERSLRSFSLVIVLYFTLQLSPIANIGIRGSTLSEAS